MNITENNKLIAEFLGFDILSNDRYNFEGEIKTSLPEFESDWNWLMVVIQKIRTFHNSTTPLNDNQISELIVLIKKLNDALTLRNDVSIDDVYNACLEFIKWYNQQNK